jgi:hypothetical protein
MRKNIYYLLVVACLNCAVQNLQAQNVPTTAGKATASGSPVSVPAAYGSSIPLNYTRSWVPQQPYSSEADVIDASRTVGQVAHATQYVDGLGRPLQTVSWQTSPGKTDMVAPVVYDA